MSTAAQTITKCPSLKKLFLSEALAEAFEEQMRVKYGYEKQSPYLCHDCGQYHLTALAPDAPSTTSSKLVAEAVPPNKRVRRTIGLGEAGQIRTWRASGMRVEEIAKRLNRAKHTIYQFLSRDKQTEPQTATVESLLAQERELSRKIETLREQRVKLIESKRFKVSKQNDGQLVLNRPPYNIVLSAEDANDLLRKMREALGA